jgi:pSer/pThr/pTyr-binding forkhead associated (FHA) protein
VADRWASRLHCRIEDHQGVLVVRDLGSKHGTWVNDHRVQEAEIHPGDRVGIGLTVLTAREARPQAIEIGPLAVLLGHVAAALLGLAIGYYVLSWLRPAIFN